MRVVDEALRHGWPDMRREQSSVELCLKALRSSVLH